MASIAIVDGLDLSSLRVFLAAVELGSVSKAAARMQISQPSATTKLQKLERQLGTQLLERRSDGSRPTVAGSDLVTSCADILAGGARLLDRAEAIRTERVPLTVAATRHVADHFLPQWVVDATIDDVEIELVEADTLRVAQAVRAGETAIGFGEGPSAPLGLRSKLVGEEAIVPVVGRTHAWFNRRRTVSPTDLIETSLIVPRMGSGTRDLIEASLSEHRDGAPGKRLEVPTASAARLAALGGSGVGFLPECWVAGHLAAGELHRLPVREWSIRQQVRAIWRGSTPPSPAARRLLAAISLSS